jgi:hypothetical protein
LEIGTLAAAKSSKHRAGGADHSSSSRTRLRFFPAVHFSSFPTSHSSKPATAENSMRNSTASVHQCGNQFDRLLAYRNVGVSYHPLKQTEG